MKEAILFLLKLAVKYGILMVGVSWLVVTASFFLYERSGPIGGVEYDNTLGLYKSRLYTGIRIIVLGLVISLILIK